VARSLLGARRIVRRAREATVDQQLWATGAAGSFGYDPIDGDAGYTPLGVGTEQQRPIPVFTVEMARAQSVMVYRAHPMGRAIVDTYTGFAVGDTGVRPTSAVPEVQTVLDDFWSHPLVNLGARQDELLRSHLLYGETLIEAMVGELFGDVRLKPIDTTCVQSVSNREGNPWWPATVNMVLRTGELVALPAITYDTASGLRSGAVFWRADFRAVTSDTRGAPFLMPVLDWLAAYDRVLWNLVDRTALARYMIWKVTVDGDDDDVKAYVKARGTLDPPESGSVEVTNSGVKWEAMSPAQAGYEDTTTAAAVLTNVAGGVGLAKPWLADSEGANRATAVTMAEPVRRRVQNVQTKWLEFMGDVCRFVVDQAVRARQLPRFVTLPGAQADSTRNLEPWRTVQMVGPEVAVTDAQINATILANLAGAMGPLVQGGLIGPEAARAAVQRAWSDFMGQPWEPGLDDAATVQAWMDEWAPQKPAGPPGAQPGVDNTIGTGAEQPGQPAGQATANSGSPL
jgi:hypothetical protein